MPQKIAIFGQFDYHDANSYTKLLVDALLERGAAVYVEEKLLCKMKESPVFSDKHKTLPTFTELDKSFELFFSIGGDGTILKSILFVKGLNIPIAGINTGRLGFLASITKENIAESVTKILEGAYSVSERSLLSLALSNGNKTLGDENFALNELSVLRKNSLSMIKVEACLNGEHLATYWSDGLIVATPTGSTGYSLSCGGAIIDPQSNSFIITAIAPHNLNARPIVIPDSTEITLRVTAREKSFLTALDSRTIDLTNDVELLIKKAPFTIQMIQLHDDSFIKTLRKKLLWGEDKRNL